MIRRRRPTGAPVLGAYELPDVAQVIPMPIYRRWTDLRIALHDLLRRRACHKILSDQFGDIGIDTLRHGVVSSRERTSSVNANVSNAEKACKQVAELENLVAMASRKVGGGLVSEFSSFWLASTQYR